MKRRLAAQHVPVAATTLVAALLYVAAGLRYPRFCSWNVLVNLVGDNAFLGLAALGMTFVILSGGIDLSVGAVLGCASILLAVLIEHAHVRPLVAMLLVLVLGVTFGAVMGSFIHFFRLPPFLVTLAGMFLARGTAFLISFETIGIRAPLYERTAVFGAEVFPVSGLVFIGALGGAVYAAHFTRFGRSVYALGGHEPSARLMGLPVGRTKIAVYALSGFCSATAGVVYTLYMCSGNASAGTMLELDAIAAVVIGGTRLSGGVGYVWGTVIGVLIYGIVQTAIAFEGTLSAWWTRIVVGALLLAFILLQKLGQGRARGRAAGIGRA